MPIKLFNNEGHAIGFVNGESPKKERTLTIRETVSEFIDDLSSPMNLEHLEHSHQISTFTQVVNGELYYCTALVFHTPFKIREDTAKKQSPEKSLFNFFNPESVGQSQPA